MNKKSYSLDSYLASIDVAEITSGVYTFGYRFSMPYNTVTSNIYDDESRFLYSSKLEAFNAGLSYLIKYVTAFNGTGKHELFIELLRQDLPLGDLKPLLTAEPSRERQQLTLF